MKLNKRELEKILRKQRKEYQRYLGVLKEDFDRKVVLILEQYESIDKRLSNVEGKLSNVEGRLSNVEGRLASVERKLANVERDIEIMKIDINFIKNSLKKKVDIEEFAALEKRVALLEAKLLRKK